MGDTGDKKPKDLELDELEDLLDAIEGWDPGAEGSQSLGDHLSGGGGRTGSGRVTGPLYQPPADLLPKSPEADATKMVDVSTDPRYEELLKAAGDEVEEGGEAAPVHRGEPIVPGFTLTLADDGSELRPEAAEHVEVDPSVLGFDLDLEEMLGDLLPPEGSPHEAPTPVPAAPVMGHAADPFNDHLLMESEDDLLADAAFLGEGLAGALEEETPTIEESIFRPPAGGPAPTAGPTRSVEPVGRPPSVELSWGEWDAGATVPAEEPRFEPEAAAEPRWSPEPVAFAPSPVPSPVPVVSEALPAVTLPDAEVPRGGDEPDGLGEFLGQLAGTPPRVTDVEGEPIPSLAGMMSRLARKLGVDEEAAPPMPAEVLARLAEEAATGAEDAADATGLLVDAALLQERRLGDRAKARELYALAANLEPTSPVALAGLRRTTLALHQWEGLEDLVDRELGIVLSAEERLELLLLRSELARSRGDDLAGATRSLKEAAELAPADLRPVFAAAEIAFADGDHDALGARAVEAASALKDRNLKAALLLIAARSAELSGETAVALERYTEAAKLDPASPSAVAGVARTSAAVGARGRAGEALSQLAELFALGPATTALGRRAAALFMAAGEPDRAAEVLPEGHNPAEWAMVATCAAATGATSLASRALWELAKASEDPVLRASRLSAMILLAEDVEVPRVRAMLDELVTDPDAGVLAAVVREELSRAAGDAASVASAEAEGATRGGALRAAVMLSARGRPGDARRWFVEAAQDSETRSEAELVLATYAAAGQDWEGVATILHDAADRAEAPAEKAAAMLRLGHVHEFRLGDRVAARAAYGYAQKADETLLPALRGLRRTAPDAAARYQAARREADAAAGRLSAAALFLTAGQAAEAAGDMMPALDAYTAALSCEPTSKVALAAALRAASGGEARLAILTQGIGAAEPELAALLQAHRARALLEAGEADEAEEALRAAFDARPSDATLAEAIARLPSSSGGSAAAERLERVAPGLPPWRRAAAFVSAGLRCEAEDPDRALRCYDLALEASPGCLEAGPLAEDLLVRLGRLEAAEARVLAEVGDGATPEEVVERRSRLAELARGAGDLAAEARHRKAVVEAAPKQLASLHRLATYLAREGSPAELSEVERALGDALDDQRLAVARLQMALRLLAASGDDPHGPLELAIRAVDEAPDDLRALLHLYWAASAASDVQQVARAAAGLAGVLSLPRCRAAFDLRAADAYERMGRFEDASDHLLRAGKDGGHPVGFWRVSRLAERIESPGLAAEAAESAAAASAVPTARVAEYLRAARIWHDILGDTRRAMLALRGALVAEPTSRAVFDLAREVMDAGADPRLSLELLETRLSAEASDAEVLDLAWRAAELAQGLGERQRVKDHLRAVLQVNPEHEEALRRLADHAGRDGEWHEAAQCYIRLARLAKGPEEATACFFQLGVIYHEKLPDQRRAVQSFRKVVSIDREHLPSLRRLAVLLPLAAEWGPAAEITAHLARLETEEGRRREALIMLARAYEQGLADPRRAEAALEEARRLDPTDIDIVTALAELYRRQGAEPALAVHLDRAAADFRRVLEDDPCDLSAWKSLFRVFLLRRADDAARCAASVLDTFGEAGPEEEEVLARLGGGGWMPGPVVADIGLDEQLSPPAVTPSLRSLFALIGDSAIRLRPQDPRRFGLGRGDRLVRGSRIFAHAQAMAPWYGLKELEVWVHPAKREAFHVMAGSPPAIVLGTSFAEETDDGAIRFALARGLSLLQRRLVLLTQLEPQEVGLLFLGVVKLVYPGYETEGVDEARLADMTRELGRVLAKRVRQDAAPFAVECVGDLRIVPSELPERALDLADRAGLLAAGNLGSALHALRLLAAQDRPSVTGRDLMASVEEEPRSAALLRFFASRAHMEVRERLGLAGPI